jgi:hypothetical protein
LRPAEFWELTPREFSEALKGFQWRWRQAQELVLSAAILIVAPWTKDPPTVQQLLGEEDRSRFDAMMGDKSSRADALEQAIAKQQALKDNARAD